MPRYLVIGGFEPSGHDATAEAVVEAGRARRLEVDSMRWRDILPIADHPMFVSHRYAAAHGISVVAGLLDEPWIGEYLARDLAVHIPMGYDGYVSVHPWSSLIAASALTNSEAQLIDYHSDFGDFPVIDHVRIDAYMGGGRVRALAPLLRARCHKVGVAVPVRFHATDDPAARPAHLVVSAGSDGWAIKATTSAARELAEKLCPTKTLLLAPSTDAAAAWHAAAIPNSEIITSETDISPLLKGARWYLSKGGGTAVAEGLAAGCQGFVTASGIFWEDEAAEYLHARQIVALVGEHRPVYQANRHRAVAAGNDCRAAADRLWEMVVAGCPRHSDTAESAILDELIVQVDAVTQDPLPSTTAMLRARLAAWRDGWRT